MTPTPLDHSPGLGKVRAPLMQGAMSFTLLIGVHVEFLHCLSVLIILVSELLTFSAPL